MSLFDPATLAAAQAAPVAPIVPVARLATVGDDAWLAASKALAPATPSSSPAWCARSTRGRPRPTCTPTTSIARWGGCLVGDDMGLGKTAVLARPRRRAHRAPPAATPS